MIPKEWQGTCWGGKEGKKERNFTFVLDSLGQNHEEKKSNFTPRLFWKYPPLKIYSCPRVSFFMKKNRNE